MRKLQGICPVTYKDISAKATLVPLEPIRTVGLGATGAIRTHNRMGRNLGYSAACVSAWLVICSCGGSNPPPLPSGSTYFDGPNTPADWHLVTVVSATNVQAGSTVTFHCSYRRGNEQREPPRPTQVILTPALTQVTMNGHQGTVVFETTGRMRAACAFADYTLFDLEGPIVEVIPGPLVEGLLEIETPDCAFHGQLLPIRSIAFDAYGNTVEPQLNVEVYPPAAFQLEADGIRLQEDGYFEIQASFAGDIAPSANIQNATAFVLVDTVPPEVAFATPALGAHITQQGYGTASLQVTGTASDTQTPIEMLVVEGQEYANGSGALSITFSGNVDTEWGLNIIKGRARDGCGNTTLFSRSFVRSEEYYEARTEPSEEMSIPRGTVAQLSQQIIDDYDRADIDDFVTVGELAVRAFDFNEMMAPGTELVFNELESGCVIDTGYGAWRSPIPSRDIHYAPVSFEYFRLINGGIEFSAKLRDFDFPLRVRARARECTATQQVTLDGWIGFDEMRVFGTVGMGYSGGIPQVVVHTASFDVAGEYLNLDCGVLQFVCDAFDGLVMDIIVDMARDSLEDAVKTHLPPAIRSVLTDFSFDTSLQLPSPFSGALQMSGGLHELYMCGLNGPFARPAACGEDPSFGNFGQLSLGVQLQPASRSPHIPETAPGPARYVGEREGFNMSTTGFGLAVHIDALNQLLWSLWYSGAFHVDSFAQLAQSITGEFPELLDGVDFSAALRVPPIVMPGAESDFLIGLGDFDIAGLIDMGVLGEESSGTIPLAARVSVVMGIDIDFDPLTNELMIIFTDETEAAVEIIDVPESIQLYRGLLSSYISQLIEKALPGVLSDTLSAFPLPTFDLSSIQGLPAGTMWQLTNGNVSGTGAYIEFTGLLGP